MKKGKNTFMDAVKNTFLDFADEDEGKGLRRRLSAPGRGQTTPFLLDENWGTGSAVARIEVYDFENFLLSWIWHLEFTEWIFAEGHL